MVHSTVTVFSYISLKTVIVSQLNGEVALEFVRVFRYKLIRLGHLLRTGRLLISYIIFRPGHLLDTGRLFFLTQSSGQDAYLIQPFYLRHKSKF